jgi:integrase
LGRHAPPSWRPARHTCASLLLHEGVSEREFMELLGHSSINITMNTYAHVLDDAKRRLAARMDGLFGPDDVNN